MKLRTALLLVVIAGLVGGAVWELEYKPPAPGTASADAAPGLAFPGLAPKLATAARVEITAKGTTLAIARANDLWGLADRGNFPVQQDKLRELLTGLTELRLTEPRTADPASFERLGVGDPASPTSTADLVRVLDGSGQALAELIVGHRRVRTQGNLPETIYVRRPGENQTWLAEGRLPVDADPQLWLARDITNIDAKKVASVVVHRGDAVLEFAREADKPVLKVPAEHPKLDDYRLEDVFRALEGLTLTDVKPAAQEPGEKIGTSTLTTTDGTVVEVTVFGAAKAGAAEPDAKEIWTQFAVRGDADEAKKLAARLPGWAYQVGSWKERSLVPTLGDLKADEPAPAPPPPALPPAPAPEPAPPPAAAEPSAPAGATEAAPPAPAPETAPAGPPAAPATGEAKKPE